MLNVNQITSQLARLPDPALQKYAQMHKDDPYIMALAMSEFNRRKQTRQGAQINAPEQPKVVDQAIQSMGAPMPEDVGIGQLPAGNMNFADGGIIAFSDGGDVNLSPAQVRQKLAEAVRNRDIEGAQFYRNWLETNVMPERPQAPRVVIPGGLRAPVRQESSVVNVPPAAQAITPAVADAGLERVLPPQAAAGARPGAAPGPGTGGPSNRPPAPGAVAGQPARVPASAAAPVAATTAPNLDAAALMETALRKAEGVSHPYAKEFGEIGKEKVKAAEEKVTGLEAIHKQFSDIYKGRRERLDTKETELGKLKDQGLNLALLQAGAAMMSTPGSFGTALGKGVKVGTEQYAAGLDKLRAAQEKLFDARDRLEEIEAQRGELSARELLKARSDVKDVNIGAREDLIKANMQMYGLKREEAIKVVEQQIKVGLSQYEQGELTKRSLFEQSEATKRTQISAGAQLGLLRAIANDPKLQAVYGKGPKDKVMDEFNDFMKANPQYLTNESAALQAFLRTKGVLSSLGGASAAPASTAAPGPVLPRKD